MIWFILWSIAILFLFALQLHLKHQEERIDEIDEYIKQFRKDIEELLK